MTVESWLAVIVAVQTASLIVGILRLGLAVQQGRRQRRYRIDLDRLLRSVPTETMSVEGE